MRYISLFSGIEAASCAWEPLGWKPIAFSEIEPFPKAVLKHHYPNVPDLGDITKIDWSEHVGTADVVVGGSPCQSFSIAGGRAGLDGASGLMWEYVRAVRELCPQWFVWENVPGALSSSHGEDFRCLLESMDGLGYGLAWRVLDAQFFGVAQRRRRVFVVGHLGDRRACEVLFESEGLRWDTPSSREKRQALAGGTQNSARTAGRSIDWNRTDGRCRWPADPTLAQTLSAHMGTGGDNVPPVYQTAGDCLNPWDNQPSVLANKNTPDGVAVAFMPDNGPKARSLAILKELSPTLKADHNPAVYQISGNIIGRKSENGGHQLGVVGPDEGGAFTLTATDRHAVYCASDSGSHISHTSNGDDVFPALCATDGDKQFLDNQSVQGGRLLIDTTVESASYVSVPSTLQIRSDKAGGGKGALVAEDMSATLTCGAQQTLFPGNGTVRRLTPVECERLQGFPDGYTDIPYRGKPHAPDSARYKALGNSMAVPVMRWIGEGISLVEKGMSR